MSGVCVVGAFGFGMACCTNTGNTMEHGRFIDGALGTAFGHEKRIT